MYKSQKHPHADWPFWKILGAGLLGFGGFGLIIIILPPQNLMSIIFGSVTGLVGILVGIWNWKVYNWASKFTVSTLWSMQTLSIGIRAWVYALPTIWLYPMIGGYLFAWTLPALYPEISKVLWREQTAPETRLGKILLGLSISLAPVAGALGANLGMFTSRFQGLNGLYLVVGPLFIILSIGFAFAFAYQLWPDRPWAGSRTETKGST